jgi:hypothetical protein
MSNAMNPQGSPASGAGKGAGGAKMIALAVGLAGVAAFVLLDRKLAPENLQGFDPRRAQANTNTIEMGTNSPGNWSTNGIKTP